jgi:dienelactone hydrolase
MTATAILAASAALALCAAPLAAQAGDYVTYEVGGMAFEGYVAVPEGESRGTVLIVHDWDGMTDYEEGRADMLAEAGYTAFAIDVYGAETDPQGFEEYRALSGALYGDRETFRARLMGSIAAAAEIPGATGQHGDDGLLLRRCGGAGGGRAGADLDGFVSFHGGFADARGAGLVHGQWRAQDVLPRLGRPGLGHRRPGAVMSELNAAGIPHGAKIYGGARTPSRCRDRTTTSPRPMPTAGRA